jgi:hypothetical protein
MSLVAVQPMPALHTEAVPPEVVMPARRADQPPRRIRREPPLVLAPVPDPILGSKHPPMSLAVQHSEVAHGEPERPRLQGAVAALGDKSLVVKLGLGEGIDSHRPKVSPAARGGWAEVGV